VQIRCPLCKAVIEDAPPDHPPRPFCSAECKLTDLHNWLGLGETYRISSPLESTELEPDDGSREH
jgi:endogenous inhibitor of DNA gyrase (YacG/DUF329 family)